MNHTPTLIAVGLLVAVTTATERTASRQISHASPEMVTLAREFRQFPKGQAHVGRAHMEWYSRRINFVPRSYDELLFLGEIEKNRFLMSIGTEKAKNRGLRPLTSPATAERIEWFRPTYLQTKYWLKW